MSEVIRESSKKRIRLFLIYLRGNEGRGVTSPWPRKLDRASSVQWSERPKPSRKRTPKEVIHTTIETEKFMNAAFLFPIEPSYASSLTRMQEKDNMGMTWFRKKILLWNRSPFSLTVQANEKAQKFQNWQCFWLNGVVFKDHFRDPYWFLKDQLESTLSKKPSRV